MVWLLRGALVAVVLALHGAPGQRLPCLHCEQSHSLPAKCSYPCECGQGQQARCAPTVPLLTDECGCCRVCARQALQPCGPAAPCDHTRGLVCSYAGDDAPHGTCHAMGGLPCVVGNASYQNGETFLLDCRTQCSCQNGTYACSSLCPQEHISPRGACTLVDVPGQCCREWLCEPASAQRPPDCGEVEAASWGPCSSGCGAGVSRRRVSTDRPQCGVMSEARVCQMRPCRHRSSQSQRCHEHEQGHHHVRRGHECKATQRASRSVRLRLGPCWSRKLYRPKMCGRCASSRLCCTPQFSATLRVEFLCEGGVHSLEQVLQPGAELWHSAHRLPTAARIATQFAVQWVLKCRCSEECGEEPTTVGPAPTNEDGELILHRVHRTAAP